MKDSRKIIQKRWSAHTNRGIKPELGAGHCLSLHCFRER